VPVVIDAHHHLWDTSAREHRWLMGGQSWASDEELARLRRPFGLADLEPLAAASGVTGTVVIQTVAAPWETPDLLTLAAGGDPYAGDAGAGDGSFAAGGAGVAGGSGGGLLAGVVGWTDLTAPDVAGVVAGLRARPDGAFLRGIRHPVLAEPDPGWLARPLVLRGLGELAASGLCFDLVVAPHQLPAAVLAARSVPHLTFVLDHLMFGSDWPVSSLAAPYGDVCALYRELTADLSFAEQDAIFGGTARRVYGLRLQRPHQPEHGKQGTQSPGRNAQKEQKAQDGRPTKP
jgi:L-fuconolactonase